MGRGKLLIKSIVLGILLAFLMVGQPGRAVAAEYFESFDSLTTGQQIGDQTGWYAGGAGPVITAGAGVAGTKGLAPDATIFTWTAHPFSWSSSELGGIALQMDFQTDATGNFDDDRLGWMTTATSTDSANIFGVQLDTVADANQPKGGGIVTYWRQGTARVQTPIVSFASSDLVANTWYRLNAKFTKLTATSAKIEVSLVRLDAGGNPTGTPFTGTLADTSSWPDGAPNSSYFTAATMWPAYKNHNGIIGGADNAYFSDIPSRFAFVVTTDWHTSDATPNVTVQTNLQKIKEWIDNPTSQRPAPAFMVITGDFPSPSQTQTAINNVLGSSFLWYPAIGNHEIDDGIASFNSVRDTLVPALPYIVDYGPAGSLNTSYSWDYGNAHFTVVNAYWDGTTNAGADTAADGNIVPQLLSWINADLTASTQTHRFAFLHEPAYPSDRHVGDSLDKYPANRDAFVTALNNHGVQTLFTGHTHYYAHQTASQYPLLGNMHQITNGALRDNESPATITYVLVDGPTTTSTVYRQTSGPGVFAEYDAWTAGGPVVCYVLTLGHTGQGTDPTASPANSVGCPAGQYTAGAAIVLNGAAPAANYYIGSWTGTANDSSTASTNSLVMPGGAHAASVNYTTVPPTCYPLNLSHTGNGSNPAASPANSTGCSSGNYVAGQIVVLSGAVPDAGWYVGSWTGTVNNGSTASANSVTMPAAIHAAGVNYTQTPPTTLVCETFNGFTAGSTIGAYSGWYDGGAGPVVTAANGVAGSTGLAPAANIFTWAAHPFSWNAADFQSVFLQADFKTDAAGYFDDDRLGWMTSSGSTDSANNFGVQLDTVSGGDGGIVTYWRNSAGTRIQTPIVSLGALAASTWYRFSAEITKLTATSASIAVNLVQLDASGNPTGAPYGGTVPNTSTWAGGAPAAGYFTAASMWPAYKNYNVSPGAAPADNTCFEVLGGTLPPVTEVTFQNGVNGYTGTVDTYLMQAEPAVSHGALESVEWDTSDPEGTSQFKYALIRFENIFGSGPGQIPAAATIESATLRYVVFNTGALANVNEVAVDWTEDVTYNGFGGEADVQANEYGASLGTASGAAIGVQSIDVTASVAAWAGNPTANRGWIFRPTGTDGVDFRSSEYATLADRPSLVVQYSLSGPVAPTITSHPLNRSVVVGQTATFQVAASGTAPMFYQWQRSDNGGTIWADLSGEIGTSYTTEALDLADSGAKFRCAVTNSEGNAASNAATLTVTTVPTAVCETFDSGYTLGAELRVHPDWFYEDANSGPVPTAGNGVGGSVGLSGGDRIFTWVAHPFDWNASDFQGITLQMDFRTDASGHFDDDRLGWMISDTDDDSTNIFGVQMDPVDSTPTVYNIEGYWEAADGLDRRPTIATLPALSPNAWYRLTAEFTKLTAGSTKIDVALWALDGSGNPTGSAVASGSLADTGALGADGPAAKYFTAPAMWPAFKNFTTAAAPADNACYELKAPAPAGYTLTANVVGSGSVTKNPNKATYDNGEVVQLTAVPAAGWTFSGWSGDLTGSVNPTSITMNANKTVTATFVAVQRTLTINVVGSGAVAKSPDKATYNNGEVVQLTANPAAGWAFGGWSGDLTGSVNPASITMSANRTVTATFVPIQRTLTVNVVGGGSVAKSPDKATYNNGEVVQLTATAAAGWVFSGWSGDLTGSVNPANITMDANKTVTATFVLIQRTLTVNVAGSGSVAKSPNKATYNDGEVVQLTATAAAGWVFSGWSGDLTGIANPAAVTMSADKTVTANFVAVQTDFNGDGKTDLLWQHQTTGGVYAWMMDGTSYTGGAWVLPSSDLDWKLVGTGDFNSDGKTDLLWQHRTTGGIYIWLMDGVTLSSGVWVLYSSDLDWGLVGTGDFNHDGKTDLVWQHKPTGGIYIWLMDGAALSSGAWVLYSSDLDWALVGTGDFNNDGKTDLVWQHKPTGGIYIWLMDGAALSSGAWVLYSSDLSWGLVGTGDFNRDGKTDFLWQHQTTGGVYVWLMDGTTLSSGAWVLTSSDLDWKLVAP